jgi:hypothetical protein
MVFKERRCSGCFGPWNGIGSVCNICKQTNYLASISQTNLASSSGNSVEFSLPFKWVIIFSAIFAVLYWLDFAPVKFIVILIKFIIWMPLGLMVGWEPDFNF